MADFLKLEQHESLEVSINFLKPKELTSLHMELFMLLCYIFMLLCYINCL